MKHTPGPWRVERNQNRHLSIGATAAAGDFFHVANVHRPDEPIGKANARLIAAAPKLYEAVKDAEAVMDAAIELGNGTDGMLACQRHLAALLARLEGEVT